MAIYDADRAGEAQRECFLCALDRHPCHKAQLEGRIITVQERVIDGEKTQIFLLDTGTTRVELHLDTQYYQRLMRDLKALGDLLAPYQLTLRVYHLPTAPSIIESKGRKR